MSAASIRSTDLPSLHRPFAETAAEAFVRPVDASRDGAPSEVFELVSRGDFVSGRLDRPAPGAEPSPLILFVHDAGRSAEEAKGPLLEAWLAAGYAVARPDLALHGARQSPKLSERLVSGYRQLMQSEALDLDTHALVEEFARQSVSDLVRTAEAIGARPEIDGERIALVGRGLGAAAIAWSAEHVAGLRACVLLGDLDQAPGHDLDPAAHLAAAQAARTGVDRFEILAATGEDAEIDSFLKDRLG